MKPLRQVKMLNRRLLRSILILLMLAAVTFALCSQAAEYVISTREIAKAAQSYIGVGSAEIEPPKLSDTRWSIPTNEYGEIEPDTDQMGIIEPYKDLYRRISQEQLAIIETIPYVSMTETRYMTAGLSDTLDRLDDGGYFYNLISRCIVEATVADYYIQQGTSYLSLVDTSVLAGHAPWDDFNVHTLLRLFAAPALSGFRGGANRCAQLYTARYKYFPDYIENNVEIGSRYVFTLRYEIFNTSNSREYYLYDYLAEPWCDAVISVTGETDDYLQQDEYTPLTQLIEITDADMRTFDMVYTADMSSIMRFTQGKMTIIDGRTLTLEDSESNAHSCVISNELANAYGLEVGDLISMRLGMRLFEQYKNLGAVAIYPERYELPGDSVELEIVGIYIDTDGELGQHQEPNWSYSINTIFVPRSLLTVHESELSGHMPTPAEFSFIVGDAWDIPAFIEEAEPLLSQAGLTLIFEDGGWLAIADAFNAVKQASVIRISLLILTTAAATLLSVYVFITQRKKEYAIMRALGTTRNISDRSLLAPFFAIALIAVLFGALASWFYSSLMITDSGVLGSLQSDIVIDFSMPVFVFIACIVGELVLAIVIAAVMLRRLGSVSVLSLLHDSGSKTKKRVSRERTEASEPLMTSVVTEVYSATADEPFSKQPSKTEHENIEKHDGYAKRELEIGRKKSTYRYITRYVRVRILRELNKSVLVVLVATALLMGIGQLENTRRSNANLFENTDIVAYATGGTRLSLIPQFMESGYVSSSYYANSAMMVFNIVNAQLIVTNDIGRYIGEEIEVIYADGYDASIMEKSGFVVVLGEALMSYLGLEPGGKVSVTVPSYRERIAQHIIDRHRQANPDDQITDEEIIWANRNEIEGMMINESQSFTIVGVISTQSGQYDMAAFTPGVPSSNTGYGTLVYGSGTSLDIAEF